MTRRSTAENTGARPGRLVVLAALAVLWAGALFLSHPLQAADEAGGNADAESVYNQVLRRYDLVSDELYKALADVEGTGVIPEYHERVLSMRRNGSVTIGGEMRTTYAGAKSSWKDPGFDPARPNRGKTESKTGDLSISTARLMVDARMHERWRAFIDISLTGSSGFHRYRRTRNPNTFGSGNYSRDYDREDLSDYLNQAYVELMKGDHSGFGFILGKVKMPFGLWQRPNLFAKSFMDSPDLTGSYLMNPDAWENGVRLPHASRFMDPVLAAMINYEMRDIIRFEAAVFQDKDMDTVSHARSDGVRRYRSDSYLPRSWQVGLSLQPLEGWELTAHFRNRYSRSRGMGYWADSPYRWDFLQNGASGRGDPRWDSINGQWSDTGDGVAFGSRSNEQAVVVGLAVEVPNTNLSVSAEYAHGWNQGFNKYVNSDSVNVGLAYRLTPRLTLHAQGEWLHVKDRSWMAQTGAGWTRDTRNNHLYRTLLGAEYELAKCLTLEAGWQYEYWKARSSVNDEDRVGTANMFYIGTRFIF